MEMFCRELPKIELHAHLNGSFSNKTLKKLGCSVESIGEYQGIQNILEKTPQTLFECFSLFKVAHDLTKTKENLYYATGSVIQEFFEENVIYLELRTTPKSEETMTKQEYIETVVQAIKDNKNNIIVKLLLSIDRRHDHNTSRKAMELIIEMKQKYPDIIKGVDLCGIPNEGRFDMGLFSMARNNGLKVTLHCAEIKNDQEVLEMFQFNPERIGHGSCIHPKFGGSKDVWDIYQQLQIPTECCLTSNVICGTSSSFQDHHTKEWINHSLPFTLATDDKGVFGTDLSKEFYLAQQHFNLTEEQLWDISYQSVNYIFGDEEEKKNLRHLLKEWKLKKVQKDI